MVSVRKRTKDKGQRTVSQITFQINAEKKQVSKQPQVEQCKGCSIQETWTPKEVFKW
jgi:hypothetical protein